jgi:hypothetical protein
MAISPDRVAANRANARKSTGPRTPEGKARASQNSRRHSLNPEPFTVLRIEDRARIASLIAGAIATYQPVNSQERAAVERIALAQHSILRMYALEAGFYTNCLDSAMHTCDDPNILARCSISEGTEVTRGQNHAFWLAFGFNRYIRQSATPTTILRSQAQAERLYRHAVEDFHRLLKLRDQLPPEQYEEPNEPNIEPIPTPQPIENAPTPESAPPISADNEPNPEPDSVPQKPPPAKLSSSVASATSVHSKPRGRRGA